MEVDHQHCSRCGPDAADVRILRRLAVADGPTVLGDPNSPFIGVVIDCETTGLDHGRDEVIELALRRFRYDADGVITKVDKPYSWLEQPSTPIPVEITKITGLVDADVEGRRIDDVLAAKLIGSADYRFAHNAAFDRKFVERRLPSVAGLAWACTCTGIDWSDMNLEGRALGWLLSQIGFFFDAHRATADVDAVVALLGHRLDGGPTALSAILARAEAPSWLIGAVGANFEVKDLLKARGYAWDATDRVWSKEIIDRDRTAEEFWLAANVYSSEARPKALGPSFLEVTSLTRYA